MRVTNNRDLIKIRLNYLKQVFSRFLLEKIKGPMRQLQKAKSAFLTRFSLFAYRHHTARAAAKGFAKGKERTFEAREIIS